MPPTLIRVPGPVLLRAAGLLRTQVQEWIEGGLGYYKRRKVGRGKKTETKTITEEESKLRQREVKEDTGHMERGRK